MKKKVIGILDREEGYAARLTEVFNSRNRMGFEAEMFTGVEAYLEYSRKNPVEILLIGETFMEKALKNTAEMVVIITEGGKVAELEEYLIVFKYQSSELIIRKVLEYYSAIAKKAELFCQTSTRLYGIYAPQNRICKSHFAWNLAKKIGQEKSVLYMGLSAFNEIKELYNANKDLADIMYYVGNGFDNLIYLVGSSVKSLEGIDCMPAMKSVEDLLHVPCQDWLKLLQVIRTQSNYEVVIVDMEECVQQFYRILDYCTDVYMPYMENTRSRIKWELCENYFKKMGAEDVWKKGKQLQLNANCWRTDMENIIES